MVNVRRFNGSTDVATLSLGNLSTITFGTIAVLCRRTDEASWQGAFSTRSSGGTAEMYIDVAPSGNSNFLWYSFAGTGNAGVAVTAANDWVWTIINKAAGSAAPRTHKYVMSSGVWTRANGSAVGDATSPSGGSLQIGNAGGDFFKGDVAAVAVWTTSVADAVLDGMVNSWPAVLAASPQAAWLLNQASTGTSITDAIGSANQTALSGTTVQAATIPNWSESAGAAVGPGAVGTDAHPGRGPSRYARFLQTARSTVLAATGPTQQTVGQATEADTAQSLSRMHSRTVGQAASSEVAQPVAARKVRVLGQPSETDTAQSVGRQKTRAASQGAEVDLAQPVSRRRSRVLGQPGEADLAQPITPSGIISQPVGQATEVETAQPVGRRKSRVASQATEADVPQTVARRHSRTIGQAIQVDLAQPIGRLKARTAGQVAEADLAQPLGRQSIRVLGQAAEAGTGQPLGRRELAHVGQAAETDTPLPIGNGSPATTRREYWGTVI